MLYPARGAWSPWFSLTVCAVEPGRGSFGEPFAKRIAEAMQPHLFHDDQPPVVRVASLGDLGGAIGAALLARKDRARKTPKQ